MINYLYNAGAEGRHHHRHDRRTRFPAMQAVGIPGVQFDAAQMQLARHDRAGGRDHGGLAHDRRQEHRGRAQARGRRRRVGARRHHLHLSAMMNEFLGTQVQDRHRLSRRQPDQPRDGARRGRGAQQHLVELEGDQGRTGCKDKKITVIAQAGPRAPDLDAPSVEDAARKTPRRAPAHRAGGVRHPARPAVRHHAGAPADRVAALRAAFAATMKDPEFLAEAKTLSFEVDPVLGEKMQKIVEKVLATPKDVAAKGARPFAGVTAARLRAAAWADIVLRRLPLPAVECYLPPMTAVAHRQHPQFLHRRPYRPRQVDARRPADPAHRRARRRAR